MEACHRHKAYSGAPCSAAGFETPLGPHRNQRREPNCDPDIPTFNPTDLSRADENGPELSNCGADAPGHINPGRTASTSTASAAQGQGEDSAGGEAGSAGTSEIKSETTTRIFD